MADMLFRDIPSWLSAQPTAQSCLSTLTAVRPVHCDVQVERAGDEIELWHRKANWGRSCFLIVFFVAWSAGLAVVAETLPLLMTFLLVVGCFIVLYGLRHTLPAVERLRLGLDGLYYLRRRIIRRRRHVPLHEMKDIRPGTVPAEGFSNYATFRKQPPRENCIWFETLGEPLRFAPGLTAEEQQWLVALLRHCLAALYPTAEGESRRDGKGPWVLHSFSRPVELPSDSKARLRHRPGYAAFSWPGQWDVKEIIGGSLGMLFFNGIMLLLGAASAMRLQFDPFSFLLIGLLVGLIGLPLLALWLLVVTAPAWRLTWVFRVNEIRRRFSCLGLGWSRRYDLPMDLIQPSFGCLELRRAQGDVRGPLDLHRFGELCQANSRLNEYALYSLAFIGIDDRKVLEIDSLTEGEARWMAAILFQEFPRWFRVRA